MSTAQQSLVTVVVDGRPLGTFDTRTGGATTAEHAKHRPGGMVAQKAYASLPENDDVTVTRVYERERDHVLARQLKTRAGRATASISEQPLGDDGAPWGKPTVSTGLLKSVNTGDVDSNSGEPRFLELVFTITEVA